MAKEAEQDYVRHNPQNLHNRKINALSKEYKRAEKCIRDDNSTLITYCDEILQKLSNYFTQLIVKNQ